MAIPGLVAPARVLAVDDNPSALYATARVLRSAGYEVIEASTGTAALEMASKADLVVLDINLPDIDGFEVCRQLRARPATASIPVLHLSASFTDTADLSVGLAAGADSYLTRPVEPPVLIAAVKTLLFARQADLVRRSVDAKLRATFDLAPIAIAILDERHRYESLNQAYSTLTGYQRSELIGRQANEFQNSTHEQLWTMADAQLEHGELWEGQLALRRKDGSYAEVECRVTREHMTGSLILVATDVTEREKLLASERAARSEAERSNRLKEEFLATLSHELRNPINALLGWSMVIGRIQGTHPIVTQGLEAIERNSKLLTRMITDLLDFAGINHGKLRMEVVTTDPYPVVRAAVDVVRASAQSYGITIDTHFGEGEGFVEVDTARLQQIVWNLLTNAIKFSANGGRVLVSAAKTDDTFQLIVKDNGRGISPEFLPRIFERFSQQDASNTRKHPGLGLGLAIVKRLVEMQNGTIEAYSEGEGQGAKFTVLLPLSKEGTDAALTESQVIRLQNLTGVVALLVEDDLDARQLAKRILTDAGASVIEASSASAALDCINHASPNILISDIGMAEENGYQLLRKLRALGYGPDRLPAMALTAFARAEDRADAIAAGFQDHMVKPLDPEVLITRVAMLYKQSAHRVEVPLETDKSSNDDRSIHVSPGRQ